MSDSIIKCIACGERGHTSEDCDAKDQSELAPVSGSVDHDTEHRDYPICPHCGYNDCEAGVEVSERGSDHRCPSCGKKYHAERHDTVTFTTTKPPNSCHNSNSPQGN